MVVLSDVVPEVEPEVVPVVEPVVVPEVVLVVASVVVSEVVPLVVPVVLAVVVSEVVPVVLVVVVWVVVPVVETVVVNYIATFRGQSEIFTYDASATLMNASDCDRLLTQLIKKSAFTIDGFKHEANTIDGECTKCAAGLNVRALELKDDRISTVMCLKGSVSNDVLPVLWGTEPFYDVWSVLRK